METIVKVFRLILISSERKCFGAKTDGQTLGAKAVAAVAVVEAAEVIVSMIKYLNFCCTHVGALTVFLSSGFPFLEFFRH